MGFGGCDEKEDVRGREGNGMCGCEKARKDSDEDVKTQRAVKKRCERESPHGFHMSPCQKICVVMGVELHTILEHNASVAGNLHVVGSLRKTMPRMKQSCNAIAPHRLRWRSWSYQTLVSCQGPEKAIVHLMLIMQRIHLFATLEQTSKRPYSRSSL